MPRDTTPRRQLPVGNETFFDHLAHWVPDMEAASEALRRLGFTLTPFALHTNTPSPGATPVPAGTGNRCIMLEEGYLEIITPTADTPVGREVRSGLERYTGLHLLAFSTPNAAAVRSRLETAGFAQQPLVDLRRQTEGPGGDLETLRFEVARPVVGSIPEGRIQYLTHHTPELLWQSRYLGHANGAVALDGVWVAVEDLDEAADRYRRYLDFSPVTGDAATETRTFELNRGSLTLITAAAMAEHFGGWEAPTLPFIGAYSLRVSDLDQTEQTLRNNAVPFTRLDAGMLAAPGGADLGGLIVFTGESTSENR